MRISLSEFPPIPPTGVGDSARGLETTTKSSDEWPEAFQKRFELGFGTYAKWCFKRRRLQCTNQISTRRLDGVVSTRLTG